jgi:hypothetical protein
MRASPASEPRARFRAEGASARSPEGQFLLEVWRYEKRLL